MPTPLQKRKVSQLKAFWRWFCW